MHRRTECDGYQKRELWSTQYENIVGQKVSVLTRGIRSMRVSAEERSCLE